jgi:hypothetical protein
MRRMELGNPADMLILDQDYLRVTFDDIREEGLNILGN